MVNDSIDFRVDFMPFGGARKGSMGREGVAHSMREMTHTKVVCIKRGVNGDRRAIADRRALA